MTGRKRGEALSSGPVGERLQRSAKRLFAQHGYDAATTAAVARAAGSSESQLVKHFGGKQGLLAAIFTDGWRAVTAQLDAALQYADSPAAKLALVAQTVLTALDRDPDLKLLFLMEGRRMRRGPDAMSVSEGFLEFVGRVDAILAEVEAQGLLREGLHPQAVRSALIGMVEGLMRDHFMAQRAGYPADYALSDAPRLFRAALRSFLTSAD